MQPDPDDGPVLFLGDCHGSTAATIRSLDHFLAQDVALIVQVGDFTGRLEPGRTDPEPFLDAIERWLASHEVPLVFVRGNHEAYDHRTFEDSDGRLALDGAEIRQVRDHIWFAPDGATADWLGLKWVFLGGAPSIDWKNRSAGLDWFPGLETLASAGVARALSLNELDIVVSHDAPLSANIMVPRGTFPDGDAHRYELQRIVESTRPRLLVHGHYHRRLSTTVDLGDGNTLRVESLGREGGPAGIPPERHGWTASFADLSESKPPPHPMA